MTRDATACPSSGGAPMRTGDEVDPETILDRLPVITGYGYIWTSLGTPPQTLFPIPEYAEADRAT